MQPTIFKRPNLRRKRFYIPLLFLAAILCIIARPAWVLIGAMVNDRDERRPLPIGMVDDASRLNQTAVSQVWDVPVDDTAFSASFSMRIST